MENAFFFPHQRMNESLNHRFNVYESLDNLKFLHHRKTYIMNDDVSNRIRSSTAAERYLVPWASIANHRLCNSRERDKRTFKTLQTINTMMITFRALLFLSITSIADGFSSIPTIVSYRPVTVTEIRKFQRRSQQQRYMSASGYALSPPRNSSSSSSSSSFNNRMRGLSNQEDNRMSSLIVQQQQQQQQKFHNSNNNQKQLKGRIILPSNVQEVTDVQSYKEVVCEESDTLVVVRFYAPWCKVCKAIQPYFYRLANQFPDVQFVEVPVTTQNIDLHQGLGVKSLPYGHIYSPTGVLTEVSSLNKKHFSSFARKVKSYVEGGCDLKSIGDPSDPYYHSSSNAEEYKKKEASL